jgi:hypothetical protein
MFPISTKGMCFSQRFSSTELLIAVNFLLVRKDNNVWNLYKLSQANMKKHYELPLALLTKKIMLMRLYE